MTETQWRWLLCQVLLDDGAQACPTCDALGVGQYCQQCGARLKAEGQLCETCQMPGTGAYCQHCGATLRSPVAEAIAVGSFDWDAWARSLRPFLGGLTPQEQALLERS